MTSIRSKFSNLFPQPIRFGLRRAKHFGFQRRCPACGSRTRRFAPWGNPARQDAICPICLAKEPHRLAALYFDQHPEIFKREGTLVHIAPEPSLAIKLTGLCRRSSMRYISGDIHTPMPDTIDICDLRFEDASIDIIYACHVMMALPDDGPAFDEVFRVLKPGGVALLQVFASPLDYTIEPKTDEERAEDRYLAADPDVYRIYSDSDYCRRLENAGFEVRRFVAGDVDHPDLDRMNVSAEVLHVATKP